MLNWAFGRFANHLEQNALRHGVIVIRTNESYTSKTCPRCGAVHQHLGGNKQFVCPVCNFTLARDWAGAINNLIKALSNVVFEILDDRLTINSAS